MPAIVSGFPDIQQHSAICAYLHVSYRMAVLRHAQASGKSDICGETRRRAVTVYDMPQSTTYEILYNGIAVANLLQHNGIENKRQLSKVTGVPTSTLSDQFNEDWEGRPTLPVLAQIAGVFGVQVSSLIIEPGYRAVQRPMSGKSHLPVTVTNGARRGGRVR